MIKKPLCVLIVVFIAFSIIGCGSAAIKEKKEFPIWKTVTLGSYASAQSYETVLQKKGLLVSNQGGTELLGRIPISRTAVQVDLVLVTLSELGFEESCHSIDVIFARAKDLGLELCPAEVGPALRLEYQDQARDEQIYIAMEPVPIDGKRKLFYLANNFLSSGGSHLGAIADDWWIFGWKPDTKFVFCISHPTKRFSGDGWFEPKTAPDRKSSNRQFQYQNAFREGGAYGLR